ncbi:bifunctional metallophosphatase/5'-nucleotidase [Lentilactobacillus curieae]|uniref:Bifunctional metallophosphatase/5'-nucleotidase n=1 Tax=Lentilactobacillus curieae TaxID=1138822 RepID=A0A1S6QGA3_9LACO|nr:bifunctional metallophosphatase/5'-nucleotidase [Lentilactobacillus curieae]AQW20629.1 bifunctional metallophosphatase/5'-nucleotidase [Lentilactobacillus curieae]
MLRCFNFLGRTVPVAIGLLSVAVLLSPGGVSAAKEKSQTAEMPIQILGVNDIHGGLQTTGKFVMDSKTVTNAGGLARLGGYLDQSQADFKLANPNSVTMRVQAGDMVGASPANSALLDDGPTLAALQAMNIKVGVLGNHEFDHGIDQYLNEVNGKTPSTVGLKNQQQIRAIQNYPFVNTGMKMIIANVIDKQTNQIPAGYSPYAIEKITDPKTHKTGKIGFIGILNTNLPGIAKKYDLLDEGATIAKYDKILRAKGVHAIIVLGHTGAVTQNGETTGDAVNDIKKLEQIDPNNSVDAFFAAHSHQYANASVSGIPVMQAGFQGKGYSDLTGKFDFNTDDFVPDSLNPSVKPVYSAADDPTSTFNHDASYSIINHIISDANERVAPIINAKVGSVQGGQSISNDLSATKESQAAYVVVDAQRKIANEQGHKTDIAITSNDSIRSGMETSENGDVTLGTLYNMQPYGNSQPIVEMTGKQIVELLNEQYTKSQLYFLQISGLTYHFKATNSGSQIATVSDVKVNNQPISPDGKYRVLTNDYLSTGGDAYKAFTKGTIVDNAGQDIDLLTAYMQENSPIPVPQLDRKITD